MSIIPPPPPAPTTVNVTTNIYLAPDSTFTVDAGQTYYANPPTEGALFRNYLRASFINNGTVWSSGGSLMGGEYFGSITNTGLAVADGRAGQVQVVAFGGYTNQGITNSGSIYALSQFATAVAIWDYSSIRAPITNSGLIASQSDGVAYAIIRMNGGGQIHNLPGGQILVEGAGAQAIRFDRGLFPTASDPQTVAVYNEGLIQAVSTDGQNPSFVIGAIHLKGEGLDVVNSGTMRGDYIMYVSNPDGSPAWDNHETVTNLATGLMDGKINLGGGDDLIINAGTITGLIELGSGNDEYRGSASSASVSIDAGTGDDVLRGGSGSNVLQGGEGNDYIDGSAGTNALSGGDGADFLKGGTGVDRLDGGTGNDALIGGGGADVLVGGSGADSFIYISTNDSTASAADTIQNFETGFDKIDLSALAPTSVLLNVSGSTTVVTAESTNGTLSINVTGTIALSDILTTSSSTVIASVNSQTLVGLVQGSTLQGSAGDDLLVGTAGNDLLDGGAGSDAMLGGAGDDIYVVANPAQLIFEQAGEGIDQVLAYSNYTLPDYVENVTLMAPAWVRGNAFDNVIVGSSGNDILAGYGGSDRITGGPGMDLMSGFGGRVVYAYQSAADSLPAAPDQITGFQYGIDKIDLTALQVRSINWTRVTNDFGFYEDVTIQTPNGTMEIKVNISDINSPGLSIADFLLPWRPAPNDLNGDWHSDFILRDTSGGWLTDWLGTDAGSFTNNGANTSIQFPADWHVTGTGDYNGDGKKDLLLRSDAGWLTNWLGTASGGLANNGSNTSLFFTPDWKVAGNGDFNGDGKADLLLRRDDGWLTNWLGTANGSFANNGANTSLYFTNDWKVASTGDFNGDGYTDLLLRRDDGWVTNWLGNARGGFTNNGANTSLFFTTDWKVIGTGDINGDGKDDLILRRDDGWITDWLGTASGGFTNNGANTALFLGTDWKISSIADFNGDGREDLLLRNDSGWLTDWLGTQTASFANNGANFSTFIAPNWVVQDPFL